MRHNSYLIRWIFLWLCLASVTISAQTKLSDESKGKTEKVDAFVRERMTSRHIPGLSLAVLRDGKIVLAKGYGLANLELSVPATEKTNYLIASITKTFTAVAVMMLVEEAKISLNEPISKHLSGLPGAWNPVTVRQLLNHTSGINDYVSHDKPPCEVGKHESDYATPDVLKEVACVPPDFAPGERWSYNNTGYHLLGMLIEKVSGKTYEQFLRERIFLPLGMNETRLINYSELVANRANGYSWRGGAYRNARQMNPVVEFATGGLISTVLDMAKWDAALDGEKLLKRTDFKQMWTNAKLNNGDIVSSYGLGFGLTPFRGRKRVGHTGGIPGFATALQHFLDDRVSVIILTNSDQENFLIGEMANEIASFYFSK